MIIEVTKEQQLFKFCKEFIKNNEIICGETIYQTDRVMENASEFIEGICDIVGYLPDEEEDEGDIPRNKW